MKISPMPATSLALELAGINVRSARADQGWTAAELAARAGVSEYTIREIEHGSPAVSVGNLFNVMATLRIPLYTPHPEESSRMVTDARRIAALLPARVDVKEDDIDADF